MEMEMAAAAAAVAAGGAPDARRATCSSAAGVTCSRSSSGASSSGSTTTTTIIMATSVTSVASVSRHQINLEGNLQVHLVVVSRWRRRRQRRPRRRGSPSLATNPANPTANGCRRRCRCGHRCGRGARARGEIDLAPIPISISILRRSGRATRSTFPPSGRSSRRQIARRRAAPRSVRRAC